MKTKGALAKSTAIARLWERLEVNPDDLLRHPTITPILVQSLGSIDKVITYLRGSDAKDALELIRLWDLSTAAARKLPFEAFCLAAKSTPKKMMGIIMEAITEQSHLASEMLVSAAHPDIVKTTIKSAKKRDGYTDRETIHKHTGFSPTPKTQQFNNFGTVNANKQIANVAVGRLQEDDDSISEVAEAFNRKRMLGAGKDEPIDVVDILAEGEGE